MWRVAINQTHWDRWLNLNFSKVHLILTNPVLQTDALKEMTPAQPTQLTLPNYPTYPTPTNPTYHTHHYLTPYPPPNSPQYTMGKYRTLASPYMCLPRNPQTLSYSQVTANNRPTNTQTRNNNNRYNRNNNFSLKGKSHPLILI